LNHQATEIDMHIVGKCSVCAVKYRLEDTKHFKKNWKNQ